MSNYQKYLIQWIRDEVKKANMKGVIVGISGGVDSSVVATLAKKAFPNNSLGLFLPIGNMGQDLEDAKYLAKKINIKTQLVDLTSTFDEIKKSTSISQKLALANIKPRLRMSALYAFAQENKYLVLGTDNAAEWILGYFTKYGDGGVDLLPIVHLTKGEVKNMAKEMNLPEIIYTKPPSANLWDGQTDEKELGFSYEQVDKYLNGQEIPKDIKAKIEIQIKSTDHKRNPLPIPNKPKYMLKKQS